MPQTAPYGSWKSPITADLIATGSKRLGQVTADGEDVYWGETRSTEGGRTALVRWGADGKIEDAIPAEFNARTRVHEYGGGSYLVDGGTIFFTHFPDQRLYRQDPGGRPVPITPEPEVPAGARYADMRRIPGTNLLVVVYELHAAEGEPSNQLVVIPVDGSAPPRVIAAGSDFYASPRPSRDGKHLAWLQWNHPNMPWDGTDLVTADIGADGSLSGERVIAGGREESVFQPEWSADGSLYFVSDRSGWWNLYRSRESSEPEALAPMDAEFGVPQWVFGQSTYGFLGNGQIACLYSQNGVQQLALLDPASKSLTPVELPFTAYGGPYLQAHGNRIACLAASPARKAAVVEIDPIAGTHQVIAEGLQVELDPRYLSAPESIAYPTDGGETAYANYFAPRNEDYSAPEGERPPLIVMSHGGPTSQSTAELDLGVQFWTSRGFAVVDVNYGGSTGYGRRYRERLNGTWGIVDMQDCVNAAKFLAERGDADRARMAIRGGSAGGYTTLCALTFTNVFAAGASYYGVADTEALALDTHKFESRYLDNLIGPYPAAKSVYIERSPVHFTDQLSCPLIILQGLEDKIVPPSQAELMVAALRKKGLPFAYLAFEGEQHGFRRAENVKRSLEAEAYFYGRVFGFSLADEIEPVEIEGL